jgi:hypothetical protein
MKCLYKTNKRKFIIILGIGLIIGYYYNSWWNDLKIIEWKVVNENVLEQKYYCTSPR